MKKSPGQKKTKVIVKTPKPTRKRARSVANIDVSAVVDQKIVNVSRRSATVDILRALAVVLMVLTHVTAVAFSFEGGKLLQALSLAGGTLCFTFFLLLSGVSNYFSFIKKTDPEEILHKQHSLFVRSIQIISVYYLVAGFSMFALKQGFFGMPSTEWIRDFLRIAAFQRFPDFTEFIIPLSGFLFISIFIKRFLNFISESLAITTIVAIATYFLGYLLYGLEFEYERFNYIKGVIAGFSDLHLFPLLQYFGIFIFGIYIGRKLISEVSTKRKNIEIGLIGLVCAIFYGISAFLTFSGGQEDSIVTNASVYTGRFPPSAAFLALGLSVFAFLLIAIEYLFSKDSVYTNPIKQVSLFISQNALGFFVLHIIFLLGGKVILEDYLNKDFTTDSTLLIYSVTLFIIAASTFTLVLKKITIDAFFRWTPLNLDLSMFRLLMVLFFGFAVLFGLNRELEVISQNKITVDSNILGKQITTNLTDLWFDEEYVGRAEIMVDSDNVVNKDNWVYFEINHSAFLQTKDSFFENGKDLRVVKFANEEFQDLPVVIEDANSDRTKIYFRIETAPGIQYFFYFGNEFAQDANIDGNQANYKFAEERKILNIEYKPFRIELAKNWYLKGFKNSEEYERMTFRFLTTVVTDSLINYDITNKNNESIVSGVLNSSDVESGSVLLDTSALPVGQYYIQLSSINLDTSLEVLNSKKYRFYTSYPLFVNWSLDWEGFGVNQSDLDVIVNISDSYNIPITHYFNPVIYIEGVLDQSLANYYTNWILNRANTKGDEIGLHNHLTPQFLDEVEVEINQDARIVGIGRDETALNGYSKEDLEKIIDWSVDKFVEVGLGVPKGYRAGAWLVSPELLQVLDEAGFEYDSSGRTGGFLTRSAGSTSIPWDLDPTTKPYRPNVNNINSNNSPTLNLLEFPNNGADSYWFSQEELIGRFNTNFSETMLSPQVVTYLSHPHGFEYYDSAKMRGLLSHIEKYRYDTNNGPVVQTTLENIYNSFNLSTF